MELLRYDHDFVNKYEEFIQKVQAQNWNIIELNGCILPSKQARLWRQGQNDNTIDYMINLLEEQECHYIANLLRKSNTMPGPLVTNDLPGCSWHNWDSAMTFYATDNTNKVITSFDDQIYNDIAKIAKKCGFTSGVFFKKHPVRNLIQLSEHESPLDVYSLKEINDKLSQKPEV